MPILTKDELRAIPAEDFHDVFCIGPRNEVIEFWRSGGSTDNRCFILGRSNDLRLAREGFRRAWEAAGIKKGDLAHVSFPLGIHPVGQVYCRTAQQMGVGVELVRRREFNTIKEVQGRPNPNPKTDRVLRDGKLRLTAGPGG